MWSTQGGCPHPPEYESPLNPIDIGRASPVSKSGSGESTAASSPPINLVVDFAHDLRSPLTSILFLAETLHAGHSGSLNELQRKQLGILYSAALGLVNMASDLVELVHDHDQLLDVPARPFSVQEVLTEVCNVVAPIAAHKELPVQLVTLDQDVRIGNPVALSRSLLNLITNAVKFTQHGFVEIGASAIGASRVEFSVRDTGPGIGDHAHTQLFDPYRSGSAARTQRISGSGLGLAICRKLISGMGAELHYETRAGWGTRFFFVLDLPICEPDEHGRLR